MKQLILIVAFLSLSFAGLAQSQTSVNENATELVLIKKVEDVTPKKTKTTRNTKFLKVNYKKSNDIISIKAYRKSLKDKLRREKLC